LIRNDKSAKKGSESLEKYANDNKFYEFVIKSTDGPFHFSLDLLAKAPKNNGWKGSISLD
jgi:hypothetical protein